MSKILFLIALLIIFGISTNYAYSQEIGLSTFQESAQIIIDNKTSQSSKDQQQTTKKENKALYDSM